MNKVALAQDKKNLQGKEKNFAWKDNPDIQKLLNVIASILADEYIQRIRADS